MTIEPRQRPPDQFSGRFILVIVLLAIAYAVAMWFALSCPMAFSRAAMVNALQAELDEMRMQGRRLLAPD